MITFTNNSNDKDLTLFWVGEAQNYTPAPSPLNNDKNCVCYGVVFTDCLKHKTVNKTTCRMTSANPREL